MKIVGLLLLVLSNSLTISLPTSERGEKPEFDRFDETCPKFWGSIKGSIRQHATNCTRPSPNGFKTNKVSFLENVCLLVNRMLSVVCEKSGDDFGFDFCSNSSRQDSICPINLNLVEDKENLSQSFADAEKILGDRSLCLNVCYDLDKIEEQCIVLLKVHSCYESWGRTLGVRKNEKTSFQVTQMESSAKGSNSTKVVNAVVNMNEKKTGDGQTDMVFDDGFKAEEIKESNKEKIEKQIDSVSQPVSSNGNGFSGPYVDNGKDQIEPIQEAVANASRTEAKSQEVAKPPETVNEDNFYDMSEGLNKDGPNVPVEEYRESGKDEKQSTLPKEETYQKIINQNGIYSEEGFFQAEDSHFFFYFLTFLSVLIIGYLAFHNKKKILAYALEGRNSRHTSRRSNLAKYKKLESNLEEAIASNETHPSSSSIVY